MQVTEAQFWFATSLKAEYSLEQPIWSTDNNDTQSKQVIQARNTHRFSSIFIPTEFYQPKTCILILIWVLFDWYASISKKHLSSPWYPHHHQVNWPVLSSQVTQVLSSPLPTKRCFLVFLVVVVFFVFCLFVCFFFLQARFVSVKAAPYRQASRDSLSRDNCHMTM